MPTVEKLAFKTTTGYSTIKVHENGLAVISNFGMFTKTKDTHILVRTVKEALKRHGATYVKIYTNSANDEMLKIIVPRMKSGRGLFNLDIYKRLGPGYLLKGKL